MTDSRGAMPPPPRALPPPPKPTPVPVAQPAGWHPDPWDPSDWRWWDGTQWTGQTASARMPPPPTLGPGVYVADGQNGGSAAQPTRKPRLPAWLSVPVTVASLPATAMVVILAISFPAAILFGFVPMLLVVPVLLWIDRVEPEPWSSRLHAFLWGGAVAGTIGLVANTIVAALSNESIAAVVSAPVSEEIGKALGIVWAVRRRDVDSVMDGLVYAGWVGLGFAVIEDFGYFAQAGDAGELVQVVVGRALLTPFAHPLFTAWTGLAIGLAVVRGVSLWRAWWGLALAIGSHALWNGSLVFSQPTDTDPDGNMAVLGVTMMLFVLLFGAVIVAVSALRRRDAQRFTELIPVVAERYGLPPTDLAQFRDRASYLAKRRALPRRERRRFDRRHAAVARLVAFQDRTPPADSAFEARIVSQLHEATPT